MKRLSLFVMLFLIVVFFATLLFFPYSAVVAVDTYQDRNGYFTIAIPEGWKIEEYSTQDRSKVLFRSPDGKAAIGIIALLDNDNIGSLLLTKTEFIEDHKQRFPQGTFALTQETICGFEILKVQYEIPKLVKEEFSYFFADGVRYDFTYGVGDAQDFEKYKNTVLETFCSLNVKRRVITK
ncbi:MAG: hypothetical protein PHQ96_03925 [Candidatus Omnitrophica bacterium]|nr:hypothetical protein [Candidatus Omnitrophota bacterium]